MSIRDKDKYREIHIIGYGVDQRSFHIDYSTNSSVICRKLQPFSPITVKVLWSDYTMSYRKFKEWMNDKYGQKKIKNVGSWYKLTTDELTQLIKELEDRAYEVE